VLPGQLARGIENAIRRLHAMLPDKHIPERELHQAVDGDVGRETKVGSPESMRPSMAHSNSGSFRSSLNIAASPLSDYKSRQAQSASPRHPSLGKRRPAHRQPVEPRTAAAGNT